MNRDKIAAVAIVLLFVLMVAEYQEIRELRGDLADRNSLINLLNRDYTDVQAHNSELENELDETNSRLAEAEGTIEALKQESGSRALSTYILGIHDGRGVGIPVEIGIGDGKEGVFVDLRNVFLEDDVQGTVKTAFAMADVKSHGGLTEKDAYIRVINPYEKSLSLSGSSSGAIITMGLIALGKNTTLKEDVLITGAILGDGRIGAVEYISPKAQAAKDLNMTMMLVPRGQSVIVAGEMEMVEVSTIDEAMEYMLEYG